MASCVAEIPILGYNTQPGWDSGVTLAEEYPGDFYITFTINQSASGIVAGLSSNPRVPHFGDIGWAIQCSQGRYRVLIAGEPVTTYTAYTDTDEFIISRLGYFIYFQIRNSSAPSQIYSDSRAPGIPLQGELIHVEQPASGVLRFDTSFYGVGDILCVLESEQQYLPPDIAVRTGTAAGGPVTADVQSGVGGLYGELPLAITAYGQLDADPDITAAIFGEIAFTLVGVTPDYDPVDATLDGELPLILAASGSAGATADGASYADWDVPITLTAIGTETATEATSGVFGTIPFVIDAAGGELPDEDIINGGALEGVQNGKLYLGGYGAGILGDVDASGYGYLTLSLEASGTIAQEQNQSAYVAGYLGLIGQGFGEDVDSQGVGSGELPLIVVAAGAPELDPDVTTLVDGDLGLSLFAYGSAQYTNYFQILLPELSDTAGDATPLSAEVLEQIQALTAFQINYTNLVREFVQIASNYKLFSQRSVEIAELAYATSTELGDFSLLIAEQFNITDDLDVPTIVQIAEQIIAVNVVQTLTQAVAVVISAMTVSDNDVTASGGTGGGAILDPNGTAGDPAEVLLTGFFQTGTVLGLAYNTDAGGDQTAITTLTEPATAVQAAVILAALLDGETYLSATHVGNGIIEITPSGGATTVTI